MYIKGNLTELHKQMNIESDLLNGNINRIFVCNDINELNGMFLFAIRRINSIYETKRIILLIENNEKIDKGVVL